MRDIALSILSVGLCFYVAWRVKEDIKITESDSFDYIASLIALIAAILVLIP